MYYSVHNDAVISEGSGRMGCPSSVAMKLRTGEMIFVWDPQWRFFILKNYKIISILPNSGFYIFK